MLTFQNTTMGRIQAPFLYAPFLGSVGSKATYFPGNVSEDAKALNFLGFLSDGDLADLSPSTGSQAGDISGEAGAWDPLFRAGMTRFQVARGLVNDSWVGPASRTRMLADVKLENAKPGALPPPPPPSVPVPVVPGGVPAKPATLPGVAAVVSNLTTTEKVAIGAGALVIVGGGLYLLLR